MSYLYFGESGSYPLCFLVPNINEQLVKRHYIIPFGIDETQVLVMESYKSNEKKKTPKKERVEYIKEILAPAVETYGIQYLLVSDPDYFKDLSDQNKTESNIGYLFDSPFCNAKIAYIPNYRTVFYNPEKVKQKISQSIESVKAHATGNYSEPGKDIIKYADYPTRSSDIKDWLDKLIEMNVPLTVDVEAFSLKHYESGIGTITFCWNEGEGIAFPVDYVSTTEEEGLYGKYVPNIVVREYLKEFFENFSQTTIYHRASYDITILIYNLFMDNLLDTEGLLYGLDVMLKNFDDSLIISYLATNSCSGNQLSLKDQAQEFAGNYAQDSDDIKDIRRIPLDKLLEYNLVDGLSTWYTFNKRYPEMVVDEQLDIYESLFKPGIKDIVQMQLTGLPVDMTRSLEVNSQLKELMEKLSNTLSNNSLIQEYTYLLKEKYVEKKNSEYKKKRITIDDVESKFNPNSSPQVQGLLYGFLKLPILHTTKTGKPSTKAGHIKILKAHTEDEKVLEILDVLIEYSAVEKLLSSFMPNILNAAEGPDGWHYLFGSFNLGGTVSGRLSSSDPNLQNLPAGGTPLGELIKSCFKAPPGWILTGIDFSSLEDKISALTTKDPNKLKVYIEGFDGHCLRAYSYFTEQMPDIDPDSVESVNSIEDKYPQLRQDSKAPTFAMTYQGTYMTMVKNLNWPVEKAQKVEAAYKELYSVSIDWVSSKLDQAAKDGYVTAAFGLRVRTPKLAQVLRGNSRTPREAEKEGRTAGNALGQSWCLLNTRAGIEFMGKVRNSKHKLDIRPAAHIHDAQYFIVRDDLDAIHYTNTHVVEAVEWQEHPEIQHDEVKLGGTYSLYYPDWNHEIKIPNRASKEQIVQTIQKSYQES